MKKVPVTILTGHLGAGKTSLLRRMLRNQFGIRIAVIENEFGNEIGIERLLANTNLDNDAADSSNTVTVLQNQDLFVELSNGCVCCSVKDSLVDTLETLIRTKGNRFDHIVIETTGLADPGPLAGIFWLDDELESDLVLDGVVCVVDVSNISNRLMDVHSREARSQLVYADRIVLNKCDLVTNPTQYNEIVNQIKSINPLAPCERSSFGSLPLDFCFHIYAYDKARLLTVKLEAFTGHDVSVRSLVLRNEQAPVSLSKLRQWIATLMWEPPMPNWELFRVKGMVWTQEDPHAVYVIQGVHKIFDIEIAPGVSWNDVDEHKPVTKLVMIGRNMDLNVLQAEFQHL